MKFCFWGNISGALKGQTPGGAELQIALLAKALALKGHEVVVIDPYSDESYVTEEGIKLINVPGWNKGIKGIRLFSHRIPALWKILVEQKADYYYVRMRSYLHLIPYLACKRINGKFIVATAHDLDLLSFRKKFKYQYKTRFNLFQFLTLYLPSDWVFNYILKKADYIFLQHSNQKPNLKKVKGKVVVFPNIFDMGNLPNIKNPSRDYYINVGTLSVLKGASSLYKLITGINNNVTIIIVGQPYGRKSRNIYKKLKKIGNVVLIDWQEHRETIRLIANAKALINTSNFEGFPNIFLEAWATGVPVISLKVNPGNVFNNHDLGVCCDGELDKMKKCIESNETSAMNKNEMISYILKFHDFATAGDRFLNIIKTA